MSKSKPLQNGSESTTVKVGDSALERREFIRKLGKYAAVTSVTTVTLMTAGKASANSLTPPPPPGGDEDQVRDSW